MSNETRRKKEAIEAGFTHHGRYCGIPVWLKTYEEFEVTAKSRLLDWLIPYIGWMDSLVAFAMQIEDERIFKFEIGPRIDDEI